MMLEYVHGNSGQEAAGLPQRDKEMDEVKPGPSKLTEQKWEAEIQMWRENKQKIDAQYQCAPRDWDGWRSIRRFVDMLKWCAEQPGGAVVDPSDIPWPILAMPQLATPEEVNGIHVEAFLMVMQQFLGKDFVACLKGMRTCFHPDRWQRSWRRIKDEEERKIWESAMLTVSQVVSAQYDFVRKGSN